MDELKQIAHKVVEQHYPNQNTQTDPTQKGTLSAKDAVRQPQHYEVCQGVEAMDIISAALASLALPPHQSYLLGNLLKYRLRAGNKDDLEQDIAKANEYARRFNELDARGRVASFASASASAAQRLHADAHRVYTQPSCHGEAELKLPVPLEGAFHI